MYLGSQSFAISNLLSIRVFYSFFSSYCQPFNNVNFVNQFINQLELTVSIPVVPYDERLTSIEAKRSLVSQGIKTGHNKGAVDMTAAAIFLQNYLDDKSII